MEIPLSEIAHSENLPPFTEEIILVDDKAKAFKGSKPAGLRGYWLQHGPLIVSQMGEVPDGIVAVQSFDSIMRLESQAA